MKAFVYQCLRQMNWRDWPESQPGLGKTWVLRRAVGINGADLRGVTGQSSQRVPQIAAGYVATGEVVKLGLNVPAIIFGTRGLMRTITNHNPLSEGADILAFVTRNYTDSIKLFLTQEAIG